MADLAEWTDLFNCGNCGESPSKGVKILPLDLLWTLKAALVADLTALVAEFDEDLACLALFGSCFFQKIKFWNHLVSKSNFYTPPGRDHY